MLDRSQAGKLALSGSAAIEFLDSVLSNDIAAATVGGGVEAALLTHNGRMLAEVRVLRTEQELLLDTERVALQALFDALHQFRLGYDAALHKRTLECGLLSLIGPGADAALALAPGDLVTLARNSFEASFVDDATRARYLALLDAAQPEAAQA